MPVTLHRTTASPKNYASPKVIMTPLFQQTLNSPIHATGIGLHSGQTVNITLRPAAPDAGICFVRSDLPNPVHIPALSQNVGATTMATCLASEHIQIGTIEHLMSAFAGLGIDNAIVEVDSDELPIMDGSAAPFVFLLQAAGIVAQSSLKKFIRVTKPLRFEDKGGWASLEPYAGLRLEYTLCYDHPVFQGPSNHCDVEFSPTTYVRELSRARTFGFLSDYERLRAQNLARGGSLQNAVVIDDHQVLNDGGLRCADELAKHKILDAIGDLYLLGHPLIGRFRGYKSGHGLNNGLLRCLLERPDAYEWVSFDDAELAPGGYATPTLEAA